MKKIILSSLVATAVFVSGCLKDKDFDDHVYGTGASGSKGIGFKNTSFKLALSADATPQVLTSVIVGINADRQPATDVSYTVVSTPSLLPTGVTVLPASAFTIASPGTVKAGQYFDTLEVTLTNASLLNPNLTYGIGLTLTGADAGYTIQGNGNTAVITFNVKNKYDGVYTVTGTMVDLSNATFSGRYPLEFELVTVGPSSVDVKMVINGALVPGYLFSAAGAGSFFGSFGLTMTFDPVTNTISDLHNYYGDPTKSANDIGNPALGSGAPNYAASNTRRATLDPTGLNKWDPATKIISIKYFMLQPSVVPVGPRVTFNESWKYVRARS